MLTLRKEEIDFESTICLLSSSPLHKIAPLTTAKFMALSTISWITSKCRPRPWNRSISKTCFELSEDFQLKKENEPGDSYLGAAASWVRPYLL